MNTDSSQSAPLATARRNRTLVVSLGTLLLLLALGFALRPILAARLAEAGGELRPPEIMVARQDTSSAEKSSQEQSVTVNGITITASHFRVEEGLYKVDVCFDMPDKSDWTIWNGSLEYQGEVNPRIGFDPIEIRLPAEDGKQQVTLWREDGKDIFFVDAEVDTAKGRRCDTVVFELPQSSKADNSPAILTIESIAVYPGEGMECQPEYLAKVNAALKSRHPELAADCFVVSFEDGGGMSGLKITNKPASMSEDEAEAILHSNELFDEVNAILGPWRFSSEGG